MLEEEGNNNDRAAGTGSGNRRTYLRSVSWNDRSPATRKPPAPGKNKPRPLLPPLRPLSINKRSIEEWPSAGSDDLGVWPLAETPRGPNNNNNNSRLNSDSGRPGNEFQFRRDKLAFYDKECSRIAEHVYLGSDTVAKNHELLRQNGITHVLNCVGFVCPEYFKSDFVYKTLWLQDSPSEDITSILYDVFDYFEDVRQQRGRVLVHCCQGVSRSTSLVIAYLMWREGQSFEDAFQYVKNARGVTNPNMGFACQLLQCQKRVHAMPVSPSSVLRMYRMAPHSPYDPLHLVPKLVNQPCAGALDSRGAFIVHVPNAIYVWTGKNCGSVMSCNARSAATQVVRYERATGPILNIREDEEPHEFWVALSKSNQKLLLSEGESKNPSDNERMEIDDDVDGDAVDIDMGIRPRKVDEYDLDFGIFHKALAGGVVPPFSVSNAGSETRLPARENSWGRLRRKLANGIMKGFFTSSKCCDASITTPPKEESGVNREEEGGNQHSVVLDPLPPSSKHLRASSDYIDCIVVDNNNLEVVDHHFVPSVDSSLPPSPQRITSDSFPCFLSSSPPKFSSKSPTLSPSSSDCASSFTFSPSSTNWSDLSLMSSRQPSPSGLESSEPLCVKEASLPEKSSLLQKEEAFLANHNNLVGTDSNLPSNPSIAERRGSKLPPRMLLPSVSTESSRAHKTLVRSQTFNLPD